MSIYVSLYAAVSRGLKSVSASGEGATVSASPAPKDTVSISGKSELSLWETVKYALFGGPAPSLTGCGGDDVAGEIPGPSGVDLPEDPEEPVEDDDTGEVTDDDTSEELPPELPNEYTETLTYDPANPIQTIGPITLEASNLTGEERVVISFSSDPTLIDETLECKAGYIDVTEEAEEPGAPIPAYFNGYSIVNANAEDEETTEDFTGAGLTLPAQCEEEGGAFFIEVPGTYIKSDGTLKLDISLTVEAGEAEPLEGHTYQLPVRIKMEVE